MRPSDEIWVRERCAEMGVDKRGKFIGATKFKAMLAMQYPEEELKLRQIVNKIARELARSPPKRSTAPSKPSSAGSGVKLTSQKTGTATGCQISRPLMSFHDTSSQGRGRDSSADSSSTAPMLHRSPKGKAMEDRQTNIETMGTSDKGSISNLGKGAWNKATGTALTTSENTRSRFYDMPLVDSLIRDPILDQQLALLDLDNTDTPEGGELPTGSIENAVLFSARVMARGVPPQYGLMGRSANWKELFPTTPADSLFFLNTNIPFSAFICGVQGSGKSHTTSCLIENFLVRSPVLGVLHKPLSALVFHFAELASRSNFQPSEAAYLALPRSQYPDSPTVASVTILVSPSSYLALKESYKVIPGVKVHPFKLHPTNLNVGTMLKLMSVDQSQGTPLYMSRVTKILREMAEVSAGTFDYNTFKYRLGNIDLDSKQREFLNQRLDLLESFLDLKGKTTSPRFEAGGITIIDLSCPFMDPSTACILFQICMNMYLESDSEIGKVLVVDEAHKYMTDTPASKDLTNSLLSVIRQQRHCGVRVIISTQEPTISPNLIDLSSITIIHRFSSPEWFNVLRRHISITNDHKPNDNSANDLFETILSLKTGEAVVFAPSAVVWKGGDVRGLVKLNGELLKMRMRKRLTYDGGASVVVVSG
ncbi:MAG: hypothetical protein M1840_005543 [Geoglossum simile]|nr:MAG: hypothetical protein M1840_005543 [Geoglossum simile]